MWLTAPDVLQMLGQTNMKYVKASDKERSGGIPYSPHQEVHNGS